MSLAFVTMVLILIRTNCANGLPPASVLDAYRSRDIPTDTLVAIPQDLRYQFRLAEILTESTVELGKCALSTESIAEARVLRSMIDAFSSHLTDTEANGLNHLSESTSQEAIDFG